MGSFTALFIAHRIFPRLLPGVLVVVLLGFPHLATSLFLWAVHVEAAQITSLLDRVLGHVLRAGTVHDCALQAARCAGHVARPSP
jgi:hypothetical protein